MIILLVTWGLLRMNPTIVYDTLILRFPIIFGGIWAYFNRNNKQRLYYGFAIFALLSLCIRQNIVTHSMLIPVVFLLLSEVDLTKLPLKQSISWIGKYSFEIYLAQGLAMKIMKTHYWYNREVSILIITAFIIIFSIGFISWRKGVVYMLEHAKK